MVWPWSRKSKKKPTKTTPQQDGLQDYVSRGGGSPMESHTGNGDFHSPTSELMACYDCEPRVFRLHQSETVMNGMHCDVSIGPGGGGGTARYGGPAATPGDPLALEQAKNDLQERVERRTDTSESVPSESEMAVNRRETCYPSMSVPESVFHDTGHSGRERWAFNTLPGFQHVQVLRNKVTKALGFALKPQFIQEETIYLAIVGSVEPTAEFYPLSRPLQPGDVLLTANGQLIAGLPMAHVKQLLQGMANRLVELTIIRSSSLFSESNANELHCLCQHVRGQLLEAANQPVQQVNRSWSDLHRSTPTQSDVAITDTNTLSAHETEDIDGGEGEGEGETDDPFPRAPPPLTVSCGQQNASESTSQDNHSSQQEANPSEDDCLVTSELSDEERQRFNRLPLNTLREEHNIKLGEYLDVEYNQWRILADRGGILKEKIRLIEARTRDGRYTEAVLRMIEEKQSMTVGKLLETVKEFGRLDIIKYAKENIVPDLPEMEQKETENQYQLLTLSDSSHTSGFSDISENTSSTSAKQVMPSSSPVQSRYSPPVPTPVECYPVQAPSVAKQKHQAKKKKKQGSKQHFSACQTCSLKHSTEYVYISYAQDMKKYVKEVVAWLHRSGMAVHYDQIDEAGIAAKTAPKWKAEQLDSAEFVLVLCSPGYIQQLNDDDADNRSLPYQPGCGVSFDINYIASEIYKKNGNYRFIPVLVNGFRSDCIPTYLHNTHVYRFPDQEENIWRRLTKTPEFELPPLGPKRVLKPRREW